MKNPLHVCLVAAGLLLLLIVGLIAGFALWIQWQYHLPSEQQVVKQFEDHRADFLQFASLLRKDTTATLIDSDGRVDNAQIVPRYRELMHKIGAKFVTVREDGSMEFALWGYGGPIMSDSYMGVRYYPNDHKTNSAVGYQQVVVSSLEDARLPQEKGSVATGLYVIGVEPEWYIYRFEYQE